MPKDKIKKNSKKENKKIDKELLEELANSLKKRLKDEEDESKFENDENIGNFDNFDLNQFEDRDSAPVLERIAGRQMNPIFVGSIHASSKSASKEEREGDSFKYMPGQNSDEQKYLDSDSHIMGGAERVDFEKVGRNFEPWKNINQESMFLHSAEAGREPSGPERMFAAERFDSERERRDRNTIDAGRGKYEPKLPKSR